MTKTTTIDLQHTVQTASATGQPVDTWTTYATVRGSIKTLRGGAYYAAQQTANETAVEVYIHFRDDVSAGDRVLMRGATYEVSGPAENIGFKNRELLLRLRHVV